MAYQFLPLALIILGVAGIVVLAGRHWPHLRRGEFWRAAWRAARPPSAGWGPLIFVWRLVAAIGGKAGRRLLRTFPASAALRKVAGGLAAARLRRRWQEAEAEGMKPRRVKEQKLRPAKTLPSPLPMAGKRGAEGDVLRRAERLIKRRRWGQAERILIEELSRRPRLAPAYHLLGEVYIEGGRRDEAIEVFEELVKRHESDAAAWGKLGKLYAQKGDLPQAIKALQQAHGLDERNTGYLRGLAEIALRMDNVPLARVTLEKLLALEPENAEVQRQLQELDRRSAA